VAVSGAKEINRKERAVEVVGGRSLDNSRSSYLLEHTWKRGLRNVKLAAHRTLYVGGYTGRRMWRGICVCVFLVNSIHNREHHCFQ